MPHNPARLNPLSSKVIRQEAWLCCLQRLARTSKAVRFTSSKHPIRVAISPELT
jgi:hypothetical protein